MTTLTAIAELLPPEGQAWLSGLDAADTAITARILGRIGPENFLRYWRDHAADQRQADFDFAL
jgi:hypothetical protein